LRDGRILSARVLGYDAENDIAALGVDGHKLPVAEIGDSRELRPGQCVFALGNPWGVIGSVTAGIVVGTDGARSKMRAGDREWIVVDLQLRPGNSGGPLVDVGGRLVGINAVMSGPEVGLAVPIHVVKGFLARLGELRKKQRGKADHSWLT
jgi:serine protease Do